MTLARTGRPSVLLIFPEDWIWKRRTEWGALTAAAATAGFDAVVTHWGALDLAEDSLVVHEALLRRSGTSELAYRVHIDVAPDVVLTTWGVGKKHRGFFRELVATFGCLHSEVPLMAQLDRKRELELCIRCYEQHSGRSVSRPVTLVSDELAALGGRLRGGFVIVKPSRSGKCKGIEIVPRETLGALADEAAAGERPPFVVQELVDDTFLYNGRRWDLRINVLLTSLDPLRYRLIREGVAKPAGAPAVPGSPRLEEWLNADSYLEGVLPPSNLPVTELLAHLARHGSPLEGFWERLEHVVHDVFECISLKARLDGTALGRSFSYPGFDFIVERIGDTDFEVRLLELNSHPGLGWEQAISDMLAPTYDAWFDELAGIVSSAG